MRGQRLILAGLIVTAAVLVYRRRVWRMADGRRVVSASQDERDYWRRLYEENFS